MTVNYGSVTGCENLLKSSSHRLCPIEDRHRPDSAREGVLEGSDFGSKPGSRCKPISSPGA